MIKDKATEILKSLYGANAVFREGQLEAIEATFTNRRSLVVQRTGWGKSLVYFTCTKLLREMNKGLTLVISPLLVLMDNQIEAAKKLGLKCEVLNSTSSDRREDILNAMVNGTVDLVLVTPETLFKEDIQKKLKDIKIGLFVVDEAHCISDWGHDFRLDYGNINKIIKLLPFSVPILCTTATANDRVVEDLKNQLGGDVFISRGPLSRDSLAFQVVKLEDRADRYTWIKKNIDIMPGSGIIYCLTQRDCDYLSDFLNKNGIKVMPYYSGLSDEQNREAINKFQKNEIKAIVATIKLGMGYDKGDIGFVIHFQQPANIVSYYQQIGRAGRNIEYAQIFLMSGKEDENIHNYFIETAFPSKNEAEQVIKAISENDGAKLYKIISCVNAKRNRIEKCLAFLENEGFIYKEKAAYYLSTKKFEYNEKHYSEITEIRQKERRQMKDLINTGECYSKFIANCLDDKTAKNCGKCANCLGKNIIYDKISIKDKEAALEYIKSLIIEIEPRKKWATTSLTTQTKLTYINEKGLCLSRYGDVGYGELVKRDKYDKKDFCVELIGKTCEVLRPFIKENKITHITCVPSLRSNMVEKFAKAVAEGLKIPFIETLKKKAASQQKNMENSSFQCYNALTSFEATEQNYDIKNILLIDDIIDSKWTITVCGYKLLEKGISKVFPFALADSNQKEE